MKFMLIMNSPRDGYTEFLKWPKKVLDANAAFMMNFTGKLAKSGELVLTQGLASPELALKVRQGDNGRPITDGVFPEAKEYLAGWWIIDVESKERAIELAAEASTAPGGSVTYPDGRVEHHLWIEVREVMTRRPEPA